MATKYWTETINGRVWMITQRLVGYPETYYTAKSGSDIHTNKRYSALIRKLKEKSEGYRV